MDFGCFLSSEEWGPTELVEQAQAVEAAGFEEVLLSDHFHPWIDAQGHSPFVWSVIGAIAHTTDLTITTGVTCPTVRTHPAVVAHAAATAAVMCEGRFRFGVGSGENLNEHILGVDWPDADTRIDMLEEAIDVIRELWTGEVVTRQGPHYRVRNARLYDVPDTPPAVIVSGFGPKATDLAARVGDGYINTSPDDELVKRFDANGGSGKLKMGALKVCFGEDEAACRRTVHQLWPNSGLPGELAQELPTPAHFEQACELVTEERATEGIPCGNDPDQFIRAIKSYEAAGFDLLYLQQVGGDAAPMLEFFDQQVRSRL